jgi:hypothetical protein
MVSLLTRVSCSTNVVTQVLVELMGSSSNTWAHEAAEEIAPWMAEAQLSRKSDWVKSIQRRKSAMIEADLDRLRSDVQTHHNLRSYEPVWWTKTGQPGYNRTLLNCGLSHGATKIVGRLLVGGQGLRGGDPADEVEATRTSCCLPCLEKGRKIAETLRHVTFDCPAYGGCRRGIARQIHVNPGDVFILCRNVWRWAEIRQIAKFFQELMNARGHEWGTPTPEGSAIQEEVDEIWD